MAEIFPPFLARILLLKSPFLAKFFFKKMAPPGIYEYVLARTKLFDTVFANALDECFGQIILLGAGFDTRVLRFANRNQGTRIFELDVPTTQQAKRGVLEMKGVQLPPELIFVPIDFTRQRMADVLLSRGFRVEGKTLFLWEGVTMYLNIQAVDHTLRFIHSHSGEGSLVAFDYVNGSVLRGENRYYGEKEIRRTVFKAGEEWSFGIDEGTIGHFLFERDFELVSRWMASDLEKEYLTAEDGTIFGRINGSHSIAVAKVM